MSFSKEFWETIYRENSPKIMGVCRRYVSDRQLAEDLMHDAFITAINKSDSYSGKGCIEAWLRKIAVNTVLMHIRDKNSKLVFNDLMQTDYHEMNDPDAGNKRSTIEAAEFTVDELLQIIEKLPEHHRLVFNLYVIDKYSHSEISGELNISEGTSKSHLARARKKIQELLYQDAIAKQPAIKKHKSLFLLFFALPSRANYIDSIFRRKFFDFSLPSSQNAELALKEIDWNRVIVPRISKQFFVKSYKRLFYITGFFILGIIGITVLNNENVKQAGSNPIFDSQLLDTCSQKPDTTLKNSRDTLAPKLNNQAIKKQPVIVKKTIIQTKTITIRDTIFIKDSAHVE